MRGRFLPFVVAIVAGIAFIADAKDDAVEKDRKRIEGTWRIVALEVNGNTAAEEDLKKLIVVNGVDGSWSLNDEGKEVTQGTSTIDPTKTPKTIDITPTVGEDKGKLCLGIYEVSEKSRRLCLALNGKPRPTDFSSSPDSEHLLVTFVRVEVK